MHGGSQWTFKWISCILSSIWPHGHISINLRFWQRMKHIFIFKNIFPTLFQYVHSRKTVKVVELEYRRLESRRVYRTTLRSFTTLTCTTDHIRVLSITMEIACNGGFCGEIHKKKYLHLKRFPRISLHCKLVLEQYWEYECGLLSISITQLVD